MSCAANREQTIDAEQRRGAGDIPLRGREAERVGQLVAAKARGDAHVPIVERDVVGPQGGGDGAVEELRGTAADGFASDDDARATAEFGAEGGKVGIGELVEDEIADDEVVGVVIIEVAEVGAVPGAVRRPVGGTRPDIEAIERDAGAHEALPELAGAGANFENAFTGSDQMWQRAEEPAVGAKDPIGETQVTAIVKRVGVIRGEGVEQLGLKRALHAVGNGRGDEIFATKVARRRFPVQSRAHFHERAHDSDQYS